MCFVVNPTRHPHGPTSRASITITSTAALSTSTILVPFRDHPCHSVAHPRAPTPNRPPCLRVSVRTPDARHPLCELSVFARNPRAPLSPKNLRALRDFVLYPRAPNTTNRPTSRASITITSTAALSTSTILVPFRDLPCHSVAHPRARYPPLKTFVISVCFVVNPARHRTEYRCAEYEYHFVEYEYDRSTFRDHPCHSVATPARATLPQKPSCPSRLRVKPPRAKHPVRLREKPRSATTANHARRDFPNGSPPAPPAPERSTPPRESTTTIAAPSTARCN